MEEKSSEAMAAAMLMLQGPPGMSRSISMPINNNNPAVEKGRLEKFRSWIDSYQRWKSWRKRDQDAA